MAEKSKRRRRKTPWKYTAGKRPYTVTVAERWDGGCSGTIFGRVWNPTTGRYLRRTLGHMDHDRAIGWADKQAVKLREGSSDLRREKLTLRQVLEAYRQRSLRPKNG